MIPKKPAPDLIRVEAGFHKKIMLQSNLNPANNVPRRWRKAVARRACAR